MELTNKKSGHDEVSRGIELQALTAVESRINITRSAKGIVLS